MPSLVGSEMCIRDRVIFKPPPSCNVLSPSTWINVIRETVPH